MRALGFVDVHVLRLMPNLTRIAVTGRKA